MPIRYIEGTDGGLSVDNSPFSGSAYPFMRYQPAAGCLLDLQITLDGLEYSDLKLSWLLGGGDAAPDSGAPTFDNQFDLLLSDATAVVIDTREMELTVRNWSDDVWIAVWRAELVIVQAVISRQADRPSSWRITDGYLVGRVLIASPQAVQDLKVKQSDGTYLTVLRSDGSVKLKPGYNALFKTENLVSSRGERLTELTLDAEPGAGLGRFPGCDANIGVTALGGAIPTTAGDLLLNGDDCITVEPELIYGLTGAETVPGSFLVRDNCTAKCSCDDFASVANYAVASWNTFKVIAGRVDQIRASYNLLRGRLVDWQACAEANPLTGQAWRAPPCAIGLGFGLTNVSDVCLEGLAVTLKMLDPAGDPLGGHVKVRNGVFSVQYRGGQAYPVAASFTELNDVYTFVLPPIAPRQVGYIFCRFELVDGECAATGNAEINLVGDLPDGWRPVEAILIPF